MAIKNSSSPLRVRKTKIILQRQQQRFKQALNDKLSCLDDDLHQLLKNHAFLHHAVINLAADELEPELWLAGAVCNNRWLQRSGEDIAEQLRQVRQLVKQ